MMDCLCCTPLVEIPLPTTIDPWIDKYIFANGHLPSIAQIGDSIEGLFVMEDWHNFSADYDKTLMAWSHNLKELE